MLILILVHLFVHITHSDELNQTTAPVRSLRAELTQTQLEQATQTQFEKLEQPKQSKQFNQSDQLEQLNQTKSNQSIPTTITHLINILKNPRILLDTVPAKPTPTINTQPVCTDMPIKFNYESVSGFLNAGATCNATNNYNNNYNNNTSFARKIDTIIKHGGTKLDILFLLVHANIHSPYSTATSPELLFTDKYANRCADKYSYKYTKNNCTKTKAQHMSLFYVMTVVLAVLLCVILTYILFGGK